MPFLSMLLILWPMSASLMAAKFVDAMVAQVGLHTIAASDVALARALGLYGLSPREGPIRADDVDRFIDAGLIVSEAERLGIALPPEALEKAWREVTARRGGKSRFHQWLEEKGISVEWARRLTHADAHRKYFTELRFKRFVFIPEEEIDRALGPGPHGDEERERVREALRTKQAEQKLEEWLEEQRKRAKIRRLTEGEPIPDPLDSGAVERRTHDRASQALLTVDAASV